MRMKRPRVPSSRKAVLRTILDWCHAMLCCGPQQTPTAHPETIHIFHLSTSFFLSSRFRKPDDHGDRLLFRFRLPSSFFHGSHGGGGTWWSFTCTFVTLNDDRSVYWYVFLALDSFRHIVVCCLVVDSSSFDTHACSSFEHESLAVVFTWHCKLDIARNLVCRIFFPVCGIFLPALSSLVCCRFCFRSTHE